MVYSSCEYSKRLLLALIEATAVAVHQYLEIATHECGSRRGWVHLSRALR